MSSRIGRRKGRMMVQCGACRCEGYVWDDRECREVVCPECGGEGYVDEYLEDEWYEDDPNDAVFDECGMTNAWTCLNVGTEHCQFHCPLYGLIEGKG